MVNENIHMLKKFDFTALDDRDFKEDSVREDIISPIIKALGYSSSGPYKVVRSKSLKHPFFQLGTKKTEVTLIPDYLLMIDNDVKCVIEAKSPTKNIFSSKIIEQVYSYAFHPEVRAKFFGVCNGRDISIYKNTSSVPILNESVQNIIKNGNWERIYSLLSVQALTKRHTLNLKNEYALSATSYKAVVHFLNWASPNRGLYVDELVLFILCFPVIDLSWRLGKDLSTDEILESISDTMIDKQISALSELCKKRGFTEQKRVITSSKVRFDIGQYIAAYFLDRREQNWVYENTLDQCVSNCLNPKYCEDKTGFKELMGDVIDRMRGRIKKNFVEYVHGQ